METIIIVHRIAFLFSISHVHVQVGAERETASGLKLQLRAHTTTHHNISTTMRINKIPFLFQRSRFRGAFGTILKQ